MTLTSRISKELNLIVFPYQTAKKLRKIQFFPFESLEEQISPCRKIGQGQPRVIIYINFEELGPQMLHTKVSRQSAQ